MLFLFGILFAGLGTMVMASQHQQVALVPSYLSPHQRRDNTVYWAQVKQYLHSNQNIPRPGPDTFRVATYNIHYYRDIKDVRDNLDAMLGDIEAIDPAVVVLQEVPSSDSERVMKELQRRGYEGMRLDINKRQGRLVFCGNLVAAKPELQLRHLETLYLDEKRNAIAVNVHWKGYDIAVIGTHLHDNYQDGWVREKEAKTIMEWVDRVVRPHYHYYMILGDMNEGWNGPGVQVFTTQGMVEVFRGLSGIPPQMTCWAGTEIDFIFSSPRLMQRCVGAFLWHSVQSDHMPVVADFNIPDRFASDTGLLANKSHSKPKPTKGTRALTEEKVERDESESEDEKTKRRRKHKNQSEKNSRGKSKRRGGKEDKDRDERKNLEEGESKKSKKRSRSTAGKEPAIKRLKKRHESEEEEDSHDSSSSSSSSSSVSVTPPKRKETSREQETKSKAKKASKVAIRTEGTPKSKKKPSKVTVVKEETPKRKKRPSKVKAWSEEASKSEKKPSKVPPKSVVDSEESSLEEDSVSSSTDSSA